jgi:hypothetical protein
LSSSGGLARGFWLGFGHWCRLDYYTIYYTGIG